MSNQYEEMDKAETFIPSHTRESIARWIEDGIPAGSFCMAILNNDLFAAFGRADHINSQHIKTICAWIYSYAPSNCWGSKEITQQWKGLK